MNGIAKDKIELEKSKLIKKYGEWTYDIPIGEDVWTRGNLGVPHTRLKRIVQLVQDLSSKQIDKCRILDLACLEGQYAIEFALHGADVVGIEGREGHVKKAIFTKETMDLENLEFYQDDVRNISIKKYGKFDVILCIGILYHLDAPDVFELLQKMFGMVGNILVIDTKISLSPNISVKYKDKEYHGHYYQEHGKKDSQEMKQNRIWASLDNEQSFVLTRPSLINLIYSTGFTSIYECFNPPHLGFPEWYDGPSINWYNRPQAHKEIPNRCTFIGINGNPVKLVTSPNANDVKDEWEEGNLCYTNEWDRLRLDKLAKIKRNPIVKILLKTKKIMNRKNKIRPNT